MFFQPVQVVVFATTWVIVDNLEADWIKVKI